MNTSSNTNTPDSDSSRLAKLEHDMANLVVMTKSLYETNLDLTNRVIDLELTLSAMQASQSAAGMNFCGPGNKIPTADTEKPAGVSLEQLTPAKLKSLKKTLKGICPNLKLY